MLLHELTKSTGRTKSGKRFGRGNSNGKGNYCGKGLKGQKARSGGGVPTRFEGGQTPLYRRLPKFRGFKRYFKLLSPYTVVNVVDLENSGFGAGDTVTSQSLQAHGLVSDISSPIKILGAGDLTKSLIVDSSIALSASAKEKITAAGGSSV